MHLEASAARVGAAAAATTTAATHTRFGGDRRGRSFIDRAENDCVAALTATATAAAARRAASAAAASAAACATVRTTACRGAAQQLGRRR